MYESETMKVLTMKVLVTQSCLTLCNPMDCSLPESPVHGIFPGKNTGVGCHFLFQEIFPTQGLNPGLLHCRYSLPSELPGKPLILCMIGG